MADACALTRPFRGHPEQLKLLKYHALPPDGHRLITSWFTKAWAARDDSESTFESFIFAWFSVNAWAACVTGKDRDSEYIERLERDEGMRRKFVELLASNQPFAMAANHFHAMWPIFKAQRIRRFQVQAESGLSREATVQHYLDAGVTDFAPGCWQAHQEAGEIVPLDWAHTLQSIYRVRCNLFHGEKSAHSEMDRALVRAAFDVLVMFFREAEIL